MLGEEIVGENVGACEAESAEEIVGFCDGTDVVGVNVGVMKVVLDVGEPVGRIYW